jgi:ATP-dependent exoDNAse (exonuclease V) beta subunit
MSSLPPDQNEREKFARETERNFSVVAPAGVGKTQSIVSRIATIARQSRQSGTAEKLVVVTFANKPAQEMQQRARAQTQKQDPAAATANLERAFFGTIHSFCVRLLQRHGHHLGLPGTLEVLQDDVPLWNQFLRCSVDLEQLLSRAQTRQLLRYIPLEHVLKLSREIKISGEKPAANLVEPKELQIENVMAFRHKRSDVQQNVEIAQRTLRRWLEQRGDARDDFFLGLPEPASTAGGFKLLWYEALGPLRAWIRQHLYATALDVARLYRDFRTARGYLTFNDQVELAAELLELPEAARAIRAENYRVILDEAQDTDRRQFYVLLSVAADPANPALELKGLLPRPGHFCMVGDFQQSIHSQRADLRTYNEVRDLLKGQWGGEEIVLRQTFRCDREIVARVNALFPHVLSGEEEQVDYVPLQAKADANPGQVIRLPIRAEQSVPVGKKTTPDYLLRRLEARQIANWIKDTGLKKLRARDWNQVAILCPRKNWFGPLESELRKLDLDVQVQAFRDTEGESPASAWLTALVWVLANPRDSYEIAGVLREVYGISDDTLARYARGKAERLYLDCAPEAAADTSDVAEALAELSNLRQAATGLPLRGAAEKIIRHTRLRERLAAIENGERNSQEGDRVTLEELEIRAAAAESRGLTLTSWARQLREEFSRSRDFSTRARLGAIQILTCQKAKGLEWDAVIVPFFFMTQSWRNTSFPRLVTDCSRQDICLDGESEEEELKLVQKQIRQRETERLLYVTWTRARHTLVLADDERHINASKAGGNPQNRRNQDKELPVQFGSLLLREDERSRPAWEALPAEATADATLPAPQTDAPVENEKKQTSLDLKPALKVYGSFTRRTLPHQLAKPRLQYEPEIRAEEITVAPWHERDSGLEYGFWWHGLMQALDWKNPERWDMIFGAHQPGAPDPERAAREWKLFRQNHWISQLTQLQSRAEVPFLWRESTDSVIEGIVDLVAWNEAEKKWQIIDWKTDRIERGQLERLRDKYAGQISAYTRAWSSMFGEPARGWIYSTHLGEAVVAV